MKVYENIIAYLQKFAYKEIEIDNQSKQLIKTIAQRNKIWPIIEYVSQSYEKIEIYNESKDEHLVRIENCMRVFEKLESMNIRYAVIKGAYLDKIAYENMGLRQSGDIDILINKKDYKIICRLLEEEEFVCGYWDNEVKKVVQYSRETVLYNFMYTHQAAPFFKQVVSSGTVYTVDVDINFSISWGEDKKGSDYTNNILRNTRLINYGDYEYRVLMPEYYLLQICMHGYRDMNSILLIYEDAYVLRLLCDIYYYIVKGHEDIDFEKFFRIVKKFNYEKYVYYVFYYVTEVFGKNEWINHIMNQMQEVKPEILNNYGLDEHEIKQWTIGFSERIMCSNLFDIIKPQLTYADFKKINSIVNNM